MENWAGRSLANRRDVVKKGREGGELIFDRKYPELLPGFCYQGTPSSLVPTGGLPRVASPRVLHPGDEFAVTSSLLARLLIQFPRSPLAVSIKPELPPPQM